ncbi:ABC transporter ATP-binding protein [Dysgonomonas capnocytophagoides]|uniref:ABC transporter ATP-binding protein n=1 Tax=Dysgonomonas capnocytophagoides TaxID=45254 RepID=UPI003342B61E
MSNIAIEFENISKQYRLGTIGTGTLSHDLNRWWHVVRGKEDPYLKVGEVNDRSSKATSDYVWALKDISFNVEQGEVLGIIGKNGAGKSTLLKILSRVTTPSTGIIRAKGRIASLLEVGTGFHGELTGRENIYMNGAILGMTKREINSKIDEIVSFSGIEKYIDTPVKRYSSGMTVRLGFAVAAHLEPEILVVDEVLAVGDAEFQKKAIGKMKDVAQGGGRTVLFVSHNMGAVRNLCQKGILLENGYATASGSIDEITDLYLSKTIEKEGRSIVFEEKKKHPVTLKELSIYAKGKDADWAFDTTDTLIIKIKYTVYSFVKGANLSFSLLRDGVVVFKTWDIDHETHLFEGRKPGVYETEFVLPDFLSIGRYSILLESGQVGVGVFDRYEDCLVFDIENVYIDGAAKGFSRGGIAKVDIKWNTQMISHNV